MEPVAELHAYLSYQDAAAGLAWLESVGFGVVRRQDDEQGRVVHAEVRLGEVVLMVASSDARYDVPALKGQSTGGGLYLWVPSEQDVDEWHGRALGAGGAEVFAPEGTEWGTRRSRVLDPEGHEWSVGTYRPGEAW